MEAAGWQRGLALFTCPLLQRRLCLGLSLTSSKLSVTSSSSLTPFPLLIWGSTLLFSPPAFAASRRLLPLRAHATSAAVLQDAGATLLCVAGAYCLVLAFDTLTERKVIEKELSRKAVHVLSGILYMSSWPIYSSSSEARYFAAVVPLLNSLRLIIYGLRLISDEGLIKSVTRERKPEELLRGPLYYVLMLLFCALVFWRDSPVGILSTAMMSGGDGFADIMGRRYGVLKLPYNQQKSWAGSISMFIFGLLFSTLMLYYFSSFGYVQFDWNQTVKRVALVSLASTVVESLPITNAIDDNIAVPLTSMLTAAVVFGSKAR